jgi:hypothetical protein
VQPNILPRPDGKPANPVTSSSGIDNCGTTCHFNRMPFLFSLLYSIAMCHFSDVVTYLHNLLRRYNCIEVPNIPCNRWLHPHPINVSHLLREDYPRRTLFSRLGHDPMPRMSLPARLQRRSSLRRYRDISPVRTFNSLTHNR